MNSVLVLIGLITVAVATTSIAGCSSFYQPDGQVYMRRSGEKLHAWESSDEAAKVHWPYAWAATAVYQDSDDPKRTPLDVSTCPEPHRLLRDSGWYLWDTLPLLSNVDSLKDAAMRRTAQTMRDGHLRVEVWSNKEEGQVVVAFGGTAASSWEDWKANAHWFTHLIDFHVHDEYDMIKKVFIPAFEKVYMQHMTEEGWDWLSTAAIIPTGHSLGGGLAQRFAYDIWSKKLGQKPTTIYAFDPSPVSAKRTAPEFIEHKHDKLPFKGMQIYRIYNRGEILASLRSVLQYGNPDPDTDEQGQSWIDIRYKDGWNWKTMLPVGAVQAHSMFHMACFMARAAGKLPPVQTEAKSVDAASIVTVDAPDSEVPQK